MFRHLDDLALTVLQQFDPERAHGLALMAMNMGLGPSGGPVTSLRLRTSVAGIDFPNPLLRDLTRTQPPSPPCRAAVSVF